MPCAAIQWTERSATPEEYAAIYSHALIEGISALDEEGEREVDLGYGDEDTFDENLHPTVFSAMLDRHPDVKAADISDAVHEGIAAAWYGYTER